MPRCGRLDTSAQAGIKNIRNCVVEDEAMTLSQGSCFAPQIEFTYQENICHDTSFSGSKINVIIRDVCFTFSALIF